MSLLLRRRIILSGESPTPPIPSNYVASGLAMHLDGINKGGVSGRWTSLIGQTYFPLTEHSTEESNAILMDGSGVLTPTNPTYVGYTTGTIEVCANYLSSGSGAILYGKTGYLCFIVAGAGYTFGFGSNNQWNVTKVSTFTCSMNTERCVLNGVATGTKASNNWGSAAQAIGGSSQGSYKANVRIYSIRIYDRILSESEMIQNQQVDNERFNLGLTINTE